MSQHTQDASGPSPGSAREPSLLLPHEDLTVVRVRETSSGARVGRPLPGRSDQRHLAAAHLVLAVPPMPPLLPP